MKKIPDHAVREIRQLYAKRQAQIAAGETASMTVLDIAKLYGTTYKMVYYIAMRQVRMNVPDEPEREDEGRTPKQAVPNTLAQRKVRAKKPPATRRFPSRRSKQGRFVGDADP